MSGDVDEAQLYFVAAEETQQLSDKERRSLAGTSAIWWADLLFRIRIPVEAKEKIESAIPMCEEMGWKDDLARCDLILGQIALLQDDTVKATTLLTRSETVMHRERVY